MTTRRKPREGHIPSMLSGLVECSVCREKMQVATTGKAGRPRLYVYSCRKRPRSNACGTVAVVRDRLDEYVADRLVSEMGAVLSESSPASRIAEFEAELAQLDDRLGDLARARFVEGYLSDAEFRPARDEVQKRIVVAQAELEVAQSADIGTDDLAAWWKSAEKDEQVSLLRHAVLKVVVSPAASRGGPFKGDDRVDVQWRWTTLRTAGLRALDGATPEQLAEWRIEYDELARQA